MALFGKKKTACNCNGACTPETTERTSEGHSDISVKVLGSGCAKCNALQSATQKALEELGMDTTIEHVTDFSEIASYGVMSTPALVVDGQVLSTGKVLKKQDIIALLEKVRNEK